MFGCQLCECHRVNYVYAYKNIIQRYYYICQIELISNIRNKNQHI